jgi:Uma2 family endonuclease
MVNSLSVRRRTGNVLVAAPGIRQGTDGVTVDGEGYMCTLTDEVPASRQRSGSWAPFMGSGTFPLAEWLLGCLGMATPAALDVALIAALAERRDRCELVDGEIITLVPPNFTHGLIAFRIGHMLQNFLDRIGNDAVVITEAGFIWDERNVRAPDVAVIAAHDVRTAPATGFVTFAPLVAIEVVSPNDAWRDVHMKAQGWLAHGAKSVWVVDPEDRLVVIHHPDRTTRELRAEDPFSDDALPGFTCAVGEFFR